MFLMQMRLLVGFKDLDLKPQINTDGFLVVAKDLVFLRLINGCDYEFRVGIDWEKCDRHGW